MHHFLPSNSKSAACLRILYILLDADSLWLLLALHKVELMSSPSVTGIHSVSYGPLTCWTGEGFGKNIHKYFLCFFLATLFYHTQLRSDKCVHFWPKAFTEIHIHFYVGRLLFQKKVMRNILCMHTNFRIGWKALTGSWLEMNVSFTENLPDEWLTILGSQRCVGPQPVLFFIMISCLHFYISSPFPSASKTVIFWISALFAVTFSSLKN